jgi:putative SOS response-associated peptidase YedK
MSGGPHACGIHVRPPAVVIAPASAAVSRETARAMMRVAENLKLRAEAQLTAADGYHSRCLGRLNRSTVTFRPYAVAMKDGRPFGIDGLWSPPSVSGGGRSRPTTDANSLVADTHDRMPLILAPNGHARWFGDEPDPGDLMRPFPADPMRMWPISKRVNKPENDDPSIVEPVELATDVA